MSYSGAPSSTAGRISCPRCAANNFDTQFACWKCGTPLAGGAATASPQVASVSGNPPVGASLPNLAPSYAGVGRPDPIVATISAAILGLFFPYIGVPAGLIFLMFDDRRRIQVGRVAIIWGLIGSLGHLLFFGVAMKGAVDAMGGMLKNVPGASGPKLPNFNGEAPRLNLPGLPSAGGPATPFPSANE